MSNQSFYQETFSQVHGASRIQWEDFEAMRRRKFGKRLLMLAAVIALAAALSGLAVAANFFGLRDILLPERHSVNVLDENGIVVPGEVEYKDFVSLSGYQDTPESQALSEWQAFLETYDQDGAIIAEIGNSPTGFETRYGQYLVYTQEMADRLEEIISKYDLRLHTQMEDVLPEVWQEAVGDFYEENVTPYSGYIYEDGTFRFDGDAYIPGYGIIEYQFSRSVRGSFNDVTLNIGDLSDFQEWGHQTAEGTVATLGLGSRSRSLIVVNLEDGFVLINVLAGQEWDDTFSSGAIGREELEALADSFDFSALTPARAPDFPAILAANDHSLNSQPIKAEDPLYIQTGIQTDAARDFILLLAERLEDDRREEIADLLIYPVVVEAGGETYTVRTPEELLEHYDETIGANALSLAADLSWDPEPFGDGSGLAAGAKGAVWFGQIEDGLLRVFTLQTDQWSIRAASGGEEAR